MVMQKIRRSKKTMRIPLIIMMVVLAIGLVGSFAIWSSPNMSNNAPGQNQVKPEDQIKNLQVSIDTLEGDLKAKPKDFSTLTSLASVQSQQAGLYTQTGDKEKSKALYDKSMQNYLVALDNMPPELNAKGQADLMVKAATCASSGDEQNLARSLYQQAIQLVPEDFETRYNYVLFLAFYVQDIKGAKEEINKYKALLKTGDERIAQADQLIKVMRPAGRSSQGPKRRR